MAASSSTYPPLDPAAVADFHETLKNSKRIIAVIGAGFSAASGLATFRGTSGLWKNQDVQQVASPAGFIHDPGLVWQFYSFRRRDALAVKPNAGHYALAQLAQKVPGCMALTQNVDHLSFRAGHPPAQLKELHGNLFALRCQDSVGCGYEEKENFVETLMPKLDPSRDERETMGGAGEDERPRASPLLLAGIARKHAAMKGADYKDGVPTVRDLSSLQKLGEEEKPPEAKVRLHSGLTKEDLPQCPKCKSNILRPDVIWFGEGLPVKIVEEVEALFEEPEPIDLCLVIGTSSSVWPAAGYAELARKKGARIAVLNIHEADAKGLVPGRDWVFVGDSAEVLPVLLGPVVGEIGTEEIKWR